MNQPNLPNEWRELVAADRYVLGDMIRRAFMKHGHDSWCSIADDVLAELKEKACNTFR